MFLVTLERRAHGPCILGWALDLAFSGLGAWALNLVHLQPSIFNQRTLKPGTCSLAILFPAMEEDSDLDVHVYLPT